jgi:hypothetical protein
MTDKTQKGVKSMMNSRLEMFRSPLASFYDFKFYIFGFNEVLHMTKTISAQRILNITSQI